MKIIKIGNWDKNGMPTNWCVDANNVPENAAILTIKKDGRVLVDRVEIVPWTKKRKKAIEGK